VVWQWLCDHSVDQYVSAVTAEKPRACLYIDDKELRFDNWKNALKQIDELKSTS